MEVRELGEDKLIGLLVEDNSMPADVLIGPGDDCAVIDPNPGSDTVILLKTDCVIENVHFTPGTDPELVGRKAIARVLSDIAAMGGEPGHLLVTLAVDDRRDVQEIEGWYRGIRRTAQQFGDVPVVGGETASLPTRGAVLSLAMTGTIHRNHILTRSGASAGDLVAVTGWIGGSFESGRHLTFDPRLEQGSWLASLDPPLRPTAMMDLSDGIFKDLSRMAKASGNLHYRVEQDKLPLHPDTPDIASVNDGEDYELLLTLAPGAANQLVDRWNERFADLPLTICGEIVADNGTSESPGGWEHFRTDR